MQLWSRSSDRFYVAAHLRGILEVQFVDASAPVLGMSETVRGGRRVNGTFPFATDGDGVSASPL